MKLFTSSLVWILFSAVYSTVTIDDDPSLWPGHMQPFGSMQNTVKVEEMDHWPTPTEFFKDFVDKSRPVLFKGLAKKSKAFTLWDNEYLRDHPGSDSSLVYVEPDKKEVRGKQGKVISLKEFINTYQNTSIYMVNGCPKIIMKDVLLPPPLRCEKTRRYLQDAVTWFSSGGTKSVIHLDDLDNLNCLFRGTKKLLFVNTAKYGDFVPLDKGGYSSIDVDKVNYTTFPQLRLVEEYVKADMDEGDCLFIPYQWIHQVNSKANDKKQNIAVNIWFKHLENHEPDNCLLAPEEATLDKFRFSELEKNQADVEGKEFAEKASERYEQYLTLTKKGRAKFKTFLTILKRDKIFGENIDDIDFSEDFNLLAKKLFDVLDNSKNGILNAKDFEMIDENDEKYEDQILSIEDQLVNLVTKDENSSDEENPNNEEEESSNEEKRPGDEL